MSKGAAIITGCGGGIGGALMQAFAAAGWRPIGVDRKELADHPNADSILKMDLSEVVTKPDLAKQFAADARRLAGDTPIRVLINNAAAQHLGAFDALGVDKIVDTMTVNVIAPMLLAQAFLPDLKKSQGSVLNIGSVHAQSTKPGFAAYATSKTALHGLTRALAVDLGPSVRVNTLAPAATATPMLLAGFEGQHEAYGQLESCHPAGRIATPEEIAKIALFLASPDASFITGATLFADGGVLSRLHDPV